MKGATKKILLLLAIVAIVYVLMNVKGESYSVPTGVAHSSAAIGPAAGPSDSKVDKNMRAGTGLASSLLPREISTDEDFGEFAPQDILKGQNFLEPRAQIGFPETVGGALRNANRQVRSELPAPKDVWVWNNSTIVPDVARRPLE